jgi:hypothetical protein
MSETTKTKIDGTYPYDDPGCRKIQALTLEAAANIVGIKPEDFPKYSRAFGDTYLWLNKGFVMVRGSGNRRAVYLHDGKYSLVGWEPATTTRSEAGCTCGMAGCPDGEAVG